MSHKSSNTTSHSARYTSRNPSARYPVVEDGVFRTSISGPRASHSTRSLPAQPSMRAPSESPSISLSHENLRHLDSSNDYDFPTASRSDLNALAPFAVMRAPSSTSQTRTLDCRSPARSSRTIRPENSEIDVPGLTRAQSEQFELAMVPFHRTNSSRTTHNRAISEASTVKMTRSKNRKPRRGHETSGTSTVDDDLASEMEYVNLSPSNHNALMRSTHSDAPLSPAPFIVTSSYTSRQCPHGSHSFQAVHQVYIAGPTCTHSRTVTEQSQSSITEL